MIPNITPFITSHPSNQEVNDSRTNSTSTAFNRKIVKIDSTPAQGIKRTACDSSIALSDEEMKEQLRSLYHDECSNSDSDPEIEIEELTENKSRISELSHNRTRFNRLISSKKENILHLSTRSTNISHPPISTQLEIQSHLEEYCRRGNLSKVAETLRLAAEINFTPFPGNSPLSLACKYSQSKIAQFVLERGASVEPCAWRLALKDFLNNDETLLVRLFLIEDPKYQQLPNATTLEKILNKVRYYESNLIRPFSGKILSIWLSIQENNKHLDITQTSFNQDDYSLILQLCLNDPLLLDRCKDLFELHQTMPLTLIKMLIWNTSFFDKTDHNYYQLILLLIHNLPALKGIEPPLPGYISTELLGFMIHLKVANGSITTIDNREANAFLALVKNNVVSKSGCDSILTEEQSELAGLLFDAMIKKPDDYSFDRTDYLMMFEFLKILPALTKLETPIPERISTTLFRNSLSSFITRKSYKSHDHSFNATLTLLKNGKISDNEFASIPTDQKSKFATQLLKRLFTVKGYTFDQEDFNLTRRLLEQEANPELCEWHFLLGRHLGKNNNLTHYYQLMEQVIDVILKLSPPSQREFDNEAQKRKFDLQYQRAFNKVCHMADEEISLRITNKFLMAGMKPSSECLEMAIFNRKFKVFCLLLELGAECTDTLISNFKIKKDMVSELTKVCEVLDIKEDDTLAKVNRLREVLMNHAREDVLPLKRLTKRLILNIEIKTGVSVTETSELPERFRRQELEIDTEWLRMRSNLDRYLHPLYAKKDKS